MKNTFLFFFCALFALNLASAQEELYVNLWYGQVKNADVERHLELEEKFYSKYHKERIKQGEIVGWDLWQILNPDVNEMTTTFIYAHLTTSPVGGNFPAITSLKGISSAAWEAAQKEAMSHYIKNYQVLVSLKGGYGPQATGEPAEYAVLNYMEVDGYRQAEYEKMELETFMPIHKNQGQKSGWGLHKVLNHYGADKPVNYITADFYDDLATFFNAMNSTEPMGEDTVTTLKEMDELRRLGRSHILKRIISVR